MKILRKADQIYIAKRLAAIYYIAVHWQRDDLEFMEKVLNNVADIAYRVGGMEMMNQVPNLVDELGKKCNNCLFREATDAIEKLSDTNVGKWIPVTERLPEFNENVLVYSAHSGLMCIDANIQFDRNATHWMPLPEPPEEE